MKEEVKQPACTKETYEAPMCEIIEMQQEGVLCGSAGNDPLYRKRLGRQLGLVK